MKEYNLDSLKKQRFRIKDAMRRGICLLLALIMIFPAGVFAAEDDAIWNDYKSQLKTHLLNQNEKEYVITYKGSQADSSYFAETKAKELFDQVMKEIPVKNGSLNIKSKAILPVWEGETLKSKRHILTYYNSKADLDKIDKVLESAFIDIVSNYDTDIDRVNEAIKYVKKGGTLGLSDVDGATDKIYDTDGNMNTQVSERVYGIIFSMLLDKLGYKNSANNDLTNMVTILGTDHKINVINGSVTPLMSTTATKAQIDYEIGLAINEINNSQSIDELKTLANGIESGLTITKLNQIKNKISEIEKEIERYEDKYDVLLNTAVKAGINDLTVRFKALVDARTDFLTSLNTEKVFIATKTVENAEASKTTANATIAYDAVESLVSDGADKTALIDRIKAVEASIIAADNAQKAVIAATKAVVDAETGVNRYFNGQISTEDIETLIAEAYGMVNKDEVDATTKADLTTKLEEVKTRKDKIEEVIEAVVAMEELFDEDDIDDILSIVDKGDSGYTNTTTIGYFNAVNEGRDNNAIGSTLSTRITEIDKVLAAIEAAKGMVKEADIKTARAVVKKIGTKFIEIKNLLDTYIDKKEEELVEGEPDRLIAVAKEAIQEAYKLLMEDEAPFNDKSTSIKVADAIKNAKTQRGKVKDSLEKIKMDSAIGAMEATQKAKDAVALVMVTELRKDYNNADKLVSAISDTTSFEYIEAIGSGDAREGNFVKIKEKLRGQLDPLGAIIGQSENEKAARDAVTKVENSLKEKDYDAAEIAINKPLIDVNVKGDLEERLKVVKTVIDATNAVIAAEKDPGAAGLGEIQIKIDAIVAKRYIEIQLTLQGRLDQVTNSQNAIRAVEAAEAALEQYLSNQSEANKNNLNTKISTTGPLIEAVKDSKVKKDLEKRIGAVVSARDANLSFEAVDKILSEIEAKLQSILIISGTPITDHSSFDNSIETLESDITEAEALVKLVKDKTQSASLKTRITNIKNAKDAGSLIVTAEKSHPTYVKKEITAAEKAVAKVADSGIYKDIKVNFASRVDFLNVEFNKKVEYDNAKKLVDKAFETMKESDINKAIDYVSKMQDSVDKKKFNEGDSSVTPKINGIQNIVDKLAGTVRDKINNAIPLVAVNDKTAAKAVTDAKKSFESFKKIVGNADNKLVVMQKSEDQVVKYKEAYDGVGGHIPHYNSSLGVLDKSLNIWKLMTAAEKSKKKEDVEAIRKIHLVGMTFEDIKTVIGSVDPVDMTVKVDSYKLIADGLENKQKELEDYQSSEADRQEQAQLAIDKAKVVLNNYATKTVGEDVYDKKARKDGVRTNLTIEISTARIAIEGIKDAAVKKTKLADLAKIEVYRDAIVAVGNALAYPTQATYKAAESAVKKCSYDYGLVLAELQSELRDINDILDSYAKAEKATKLVEIAEQTKLQSDVDKARMDVNMLDDSNPAKKLLGERLDAVQKFIDTKDDVDRDATTAARGLLEKALINITQASRYFDLTTLTDQQILEAYALLRGREGVDEEGKPIIEAGARHFIRDAKSEINKISDILLKETLNKLIIQREEELESALHEIHIKASENLLSIANVAANERLALATDRSKVECGEWTEEKWTDERLKLEQQARRAIEEARNTIDEMFLPGFMTQKDNLMRWLNEIIGDLANENAED
ncbi:MAG: hypothetical protein GX053_03430 [Tissierella sp.]|nr:hypothetical protein [Tissierella sp.]